MTDIVNKNKMTQPLFFWILGIAGSVILILLSVVGFYVRNNIKMSANLNEAVSNLKTVTKVLQTNLLNFGNNCSENRTVITTRLNQHAKEIDAHSTEIAVLKEKVK